jgi:hypothetical protein
MTFASNGLAPVSTALPCNGFAFELKKKMELLFTI